MIIRAPIVVTMAGPPIENGAVVVRGNEIFEVGTWRDVRGRDADEIWDLDGTVLLPGLINAHCHLDYTDLRGMIPPAASFTDWIRAINEQKSVWEEEDYLRSIQNGFKEAERFGTTTIVNFEAFPDLIAKVGSPLLRTWWLAEMIDVRNRVSAGEVFRKAAGHSLTRVGLAPHAPFTASRRLYAETAEVGGFARGILRSTHLAESRDEMQMFREAKGPLFEFMRSLGRPMDDCGHATPLATLLNHEVLDGRWLVAHLNELTEDDFRLLEDAPKFSIAHCPRSHAYFGHARFQLRRLRDLGFNICVGTDSLASNPDLSLFAELRQLAAAESSLSACDLLKMVTTNAAAALGEEERLGRIAAGFRADLIAVPKVENTRNVYERIVAFTGTDPWLMIDGCTRENA